MNCADLEERIALLAGGELPESERPTVDRHLEACEKCRALAAELGEVRGLLGELAREAPPEETLAEVRSQVRRRVARPTRRWPWAAVAAAATVLIVAGVEWQERQEIVPPPPLVARAPEAPPVFKAPLVSERASAPAPVRVAVPVPIVAESRPSAPERSEPLVVKFLTDDPDIVIYWIADEIGG